MARSKQPEIQWLETVEAHDYPAAESYLRRVLEAVLDLGRHILAKGLGEGTLEYKQVALALQRAGVLDEALAEVTSR